MVESVALNVPTEWMERAQRLAEAKTRADPGSAAWTACDVLQVAISVGLKDMEHPEG